MSISEAINTYLIKNNMNVGQLARRAGVSTTYVTNLANGKRVPKTQTRVVYRLANAMSVKVSDLIDNPINEPSDFGARLKDELIRRNWTATMLAKRSGVNNRTISKYMTGSAPISLTNSICKIASALHINSRWLFYGVGEKSSTYIPNKTVTTVPTVATKVAEVNEKISEKVEHTVVFYLTLKNTMKFNIPASFSKKDRERLQSFVMSLPTCD